MQLTIIKKDKLNVFMLPEQVNGSYWITDFENGKEINLINIEAKENNWNLTSNDDAYVVDKNNVMVPNVILKEYSFYLIKNNYKNEMHYLYCAPLYDKTYKELGIENKILVGFNSSCNICYQLKGIPDKAFEIEKKDKYYYLKILSSDSSVYVNKTRVFTSKRLEYGDIIFIFGLKIILMRKNSQDYLLVNNPYNLLQYNASYVNVVPQKVDFIDDNAELSNDSKYKEDNYFYRTPHFYKTIEPFVLSVDSPPSKKEEDKTPAILTVGPMLTMSMMSVVMLLSTFSSIKKGERDMKSSMTSIIMSIVMLASCLLWPTLTRAYTKFSNKMYERKRQKLYKKYINKLEKKVIEELETQRKSLIENNFSVLNTQKIIKEHNVNLWQRRITDDDFLTLPVGIGNLPMQIEIKYPEEHFSLLEDNLLDIARSLGKTERILNDVPITFSFYENIATGIVGSSIITKAFIDRLILQMMANYSYDELKFVMFTSKDNEDLWDYIKILPHSWSNDKSIRYFGSSNDDYREIIYSLEQIYNQRKQTNNQKQKFDTQYVIITDAIKSIDNYDFIKNIMKNEENYGFSIIMLVDKVIALPNECKNFIDVSENECTIYSSIINTNNQKFKIDFSSIEDIYNCAEELANIPLNIKNEVEASLPDVYQFLEMYQVGKVEQLNALERWKKNNPILSLQAPVGIGKSGEIINLDLHEKYHGPHGLIAGTTGSGKSEFIITFILSLGINYHPYEVQIILIDYKGGSLAGAFYNDSYQLPHLTGTITNLDGNELNRSLVSIESEVKRRQGEFNKAKKIANESTIDIYKYQRLYREGKLKGMEPIAHLFIISDEFAELKEQQPEFMDKLVSVARVGRSLGIHLILATQKPGGVVNAQIWSNSRFKVCLKVQDTSDSQEVLKKPDAAYLKKIGRFYLQVGYDEVYTLGQSAWAGAKYYPSVSFKKTVDTSVNVINNIGFVTTTKDVEVVKKEKAQGEELPNIVKYLSDIANNENIKIKKLWLDKIPDKIYVDALKSKYNFVRKPFYLDPIIGEYDDPANQNQFALTIPFSQHGNVLVFGMAGSGKETFLSTLIYSCMVSYSPNEVNFYIIDFGSEILRMYKDSPYVGGIVYVTEEDELLKLLKLINFELEVRKEKFANHGGNYQSYIEAKIEQLPNIIVILNNYEAFSENYDPLTDEITQITRECYKYGIYFVITATADNSIRMRTKQNFSLTYVLQQNDESEFSNILGNCRGKMPAKYKGRGLFKKDFIYEFQTAYVTKENLNQYITAYCKAQMEKINYRAKQIPVLPNIVNYEAVKNNITNDDNLVVGINNETIEITKYNLYKNVINLISSDEIDNTFDLVNALANQIIYQKNKKLIFVNTTEKVFNNPNLSDKLCTKNFDELITNINNYVEENYKIYEESNYSTEILKDKTKYVIFIYGIYDFINKLSSDNNKLLSEMIRKLDQINLVSFIIADNPDVIKNYAYEDWFKNGSDIGRGIWVGSGISDQSLFKITRVSSEDRKDITNDYGFIIQTAKIHKIKLLTNFNIKE